MGVAGISIGVLLVGLSRAAFANSAYRSALAFALSNAVIIAVYTVVDGLGVRVAVQNGGSAVQYVSQHLQLGVAAIATLDDLLQYLRGTADKTLGAYAGPVLAYRERYGV